MVRIITLLSLLLFLQTAYGQLPNTNPAGGFRQVVGAVSTIGDNLRASKAMQERNKEQEELELNYHAMVASADTLYSNKKYQQAIDRYNEALKVKQDQYPKDQITKARAELAREQKDTYQLLIDKADSCYNELNYAEAVKRYNQALSVKEAQYPKDRIALANAAITRWQSVHFSGMLISDTRIDGQSSKAYGDDPYSDFVQPGRYNRIERTLIYSGFQTLDGIAVPAGIRLIVYSERDFKGTVLLDVTGPAVINNAARRQEEQSAELHAKTYEPSLLQSSFPTAVRKWSESDMQSWVNGSMEIRKN